MANFNNQEDSSTSEDHERFLFWSKRHQLVASGAMKMPEEEMDWEEFFSLPAGNMKPEIAVAALVDIRKGFKHQITRA